MHTLPKRNSELSTAWLTVTFYDKTGAAAVPVSASYRIDCRTTGTPIRAETALTITAEPSVEITLTPEDSQIISDVNKREIRTVTVKAVYGAGDQIYSEYDYFAENLRFAP